MTGVKWFGHGGILGTLVGLAVLSLACEDERWESQHVPVQTFGVAETPVWEVGGRSGAEVSDVGESEILHRIAGAKRLADGSVAVALQGPAQVRRYGPDGTHLWTVGRRGAGPGDFQRPAVLESCSGENGIVVYDEALYRVTTLSTNGDLVATWSLPFEGSPPYQATCAPNGRMIYHGWGALPNDPGIVRWRVPVMWAVEGSGPHIVRDSVQAHERVLDDQTGSYMDRPWSKQLVLGGTDLGVWIGTGDEYLLELVGWDGLPIAAARWSGRDLMATQQDADRFREELVAGMDGDTRERWVRESWPGWEQLLPSRVPAYSKLIANSEGLVWVGSWEGELWLSRLRGHPGTRWDELDGSGMWVRQVTIPANMSPLDFGAEWVLVVVRDDLGAERLAVYEFQGVVVA